MKLLYQHFEELLRKTTIVASKIKENLAKLKAKGMIERIGPDKGGYWKIITKNGNE